VSAAEPGPSAAELAAAVLRRTWPAPAGADPAWRGRAADEALLLVELCRWLEARRRRPAAPVPAGLAAVFAALARRGAPAGAARAFVEQVVAQAHAELAGAGPAADTRTRAERDTRLAVGMLERSYRDLAPIMRVRVGRPLALARHR
jgi:hypothetical protein